MSKRESKAKKFDGQAAAAAGAISHSNENFMAITIEAEGFQKLIHFASSNGGTWTHEDFLS